jgi:hypothetical protein
MNNLAGLASPSRRTNTAIDSSFWPENALFGVQTGGLRDIYGESINILIAPWTPSEELRTAISAAKYDDLPELDAVIESERIPLLLPELVHTPIGKALLQELLPAISAFRDLLPCKRIRVMLMRTLGRTCPLFHVDRVTLRMLCTFRGPGTEWVANADVARKGLGRGDNDKVIVPGTVIYSIPAFHLCVLKGDAYKGNAGRGIVHRSPSVPGNAGGRWYLRVDFDD